MYSIKKEQMKEENGPLVENEQMLWHGTSPECVGSIASYGFNRSHCGKNGMHLLHWLSIRQHIQFKICSLMRNCLTGSALQYLKAYSIPVSSIPSCSNLRSSVLGHLVVFRTRTSMTQSRSFAIVGPSNWNKLPHSFIHSFRPFL